MVALVIGMIGVLVIMQVARTGEAQKRVTTGSGSSQTNAALAIYSMQRDIKQAGYGFNAPNVLACKLKVYPSSSAEESYDEDSSCPPKIKPTFPDSSYIVPVMINPPSQELPAGDEGTDILRIVYGNGTGAPEGDAIVNVYSSGTNQQFGLKAANFDVCERVSDHKKVGGWIVVAPSLEPTTDCTLRMTEILEVEDTSFIVQNDGSVGQANADSTSKDIVAEESKITAPNVNAKPGEFVFDLGLAPRIVAYAVRHGNLTVCDYTQKDCSDVDNWTVIANGIVSLRAQYGHDTGSVGSIDQWDQKTPLLTPDQKKFACEWSRISAVRLVLVARNSEPVGRECVVDSDTCPTQASPVWTGGRESDDNPSPAAIDLSLASPDSSNADSWKHYRYQVYETVVPLRNISWMGPC
jgi:type IV pilus assembly protein PilW